VACTAIFNIKIDCDVFSIVENESPQIDFVIRAIVTAFCLQKDYK